MDNFRAYLNLNRIKGVPYVDQQIPNSFSFLVNNPSVSSQQTGVETPIKSTFLLPKNADSVQTANVDDDVATQKSNSFSPPNSADIQPVAQTGFLQISNFPTNENSGCSN